jgi:hypothetical protein
MFPKWPKVVACHRPSNLFQNPSLTITNTTNPTPNPPQMPVKVAIDQQTA